MEIKSLTVGEFETRVFSESYDRIYRCLTLLKDDEVWEQIHPNVPSTGNLILHLCGNARQWILSGLGGRLDNRERELEFMPQPNIKKSELVFLLENLKVNLRETISDLPESEYYRVRKIQGFEVSGFSALMHVLEHFSYHTGQITTNTKVVTGMDTGYYKGMNLNKHNG
jgi:uncharacterized damage-inducible protein DinB